MQKFNLWVNLARDGRVLGFAILAVDLPLAARDEALDLLEVEWDDAGWDTFATGDARHCLESATFILGSQEKFVAERAKCLPSFSQRKG